MVQNHVFGSFLLFPLFFLPPFFSSPLSLLPPVIFIPRTSIYRVFFMGSLFFPKKKEARGTSYTLHCAVQSTTNIYIYTCSITDAILPSVPFQPHHAPRITHVFLMHLPQVQGGNRSLKPLTWASSSTRLKRLLHAPVLGGTM